ncbi:MAG: glycosyltransferase family 2 protein [Thermoanaerobaculia bacterium]
MTSLDVIVLTFNEERNLPDCLSGLKGLPAHIFVVDSGSTDESVSIAKASGCDLVTHPFTTHAEQWRWALESLPLTAEWVLALDADQEVSEELRSSIDDLIRSSDHSVAGAYLNRRQVFRGQWIRHGGYYPKYLLKLFRRSAVSVGRDYVDHHFVVNGRAVKLRGDLIEANRNEDEIAVWIAKHNRYAVLQAREDLSIPGTGPSAHFLGSPDERVAFLKAIWRRLPLFLRPFLYFAYRYVVRLGFLDGKQGFVFHFMQAFWYRLLVDINIEEQRSSRDRSHSR